MEERRILATFQGLGDLPGGAVSSAAYGVSDDGQVVVGWSDDGVTTQPFRWSASEGMTTLATDQPFGGIAWATSDDGAVIAGQLLTSAGGFGSTGGSARWNNQQLALIADPASVALDISSDGRFMVGTNRGTDNVLEAYLWDSLSATTTRLGGLSASQGSVARGVSRDGAVTAGYAVGSDGLYKPFRWDAVNGMSSLGITGKGLGLSADGSTIVGWGQVVEGTRGKKFRMTHKEAFRWSDRSGSPQLEYLGDLPGGEVMSIAEGVSGNGSVVVGYSSTSSGNEAFVWDEANGMRSLQGILENVYGLDLTGWQLTVARGVTADGSTIVGNGINPNGDTEAFIASFGPASAGITVSPTSDLETTEAGGTATFELVLDTQPSADVTVGISSGDNSEGVANVTSVTFTPSDWDVPQVVTVTGTDDSEIDGDTGYTMITAAAVSTDPDYDGLNAADVSLVNVDDDGADTVIAFYVFDIRFESRRGGNDWRGVVEIRTDSNENRAGDAGDSVAPGVSITVAFNGQTFSGMTDSDGLFRTDWQRKLAHGSFHANVVDLALAAHEWNFWLDLEDDSDGDGLPDGLLTI